MTITLRIILLVASVLNCAWIICRIRKSQAKIEDSVFWVLFSGLLICLSVFPQIIEWGAAVTGIQSSVNFLFLTIIFVLIVKIFQLSVKLSQIESKLQTLAQTYAIDKFSIMEKKAVDELKNNDINFSDDLCDPSLQQIGASAKTVREDFSYEREKTLVRE